MRDPDWRFTLLAFLCVFGPMVVGQIIAWAQAGEFQNVKIGEWAHVGIGYRLRQLWACVNPVPFCRRLLKRGGN